MLIPLYYQVIKFTGLAFRPRSGIVISVVALAQGEA